MKLTDRQLKLFKLYLYKDLKIFYGSKLNNINHLSDMDDFCTIVSIDEATIEEQVNNRDKIINYPSDAKSYIINVRICDQMDHLKGMLMKYFVTTIGFDPYPVPETLIDIKLLSHMAYKLEK